MRGGSDSLGVLSSSSSRAGISVGVMVLAVIFLSRCKRPHSKCAPQTCPVFIRHPIARRMRRAGEDCVPSTGDIFVRKRSASNGRPVLDLAGSIPDNKFGRILDNPFADNGNSLLPERLSVSGNGEVTRCKTRQLDHAGLTIQPSPLVSLDAAWPKPLPNNWLIGQVGGLAVDKHDHIWINQRPRSLTDDEKGALPTPPIRTQPRSLCCKPAPSVMQF